MEITKVYTTDKVITALHIDDEGLEYPVLIGALHTPAILTPLLKSGYQLFGLPYDIRKDNVKLTDLPSEEKRMTQFTEEEQMELANSTSGIIYSEQDLMNFLVKQELAVINFTKSLNLIKTREEMEAFLQEWESGKISSTDVRSYLPLNSFVSVNALYTYEEYINGQAIYLPIINKRRNLNREQYELLIKNFLAMGMSPTADYKMIQDFYYNWGICGLNFPINSIRKVVRPEIVGVSKSVIATASKYVKYRATDELLTWADRTGKVYLPKGYENYKVVDGSLSGGIRTEIGEKEARLTGNLKGTTLVTPVTASDYTNVEVTVYDGPQVTIERDVNNVNIITPSDEFLSSSLNVTLEGSVISQELLDYPLNKEKLKDIYTDIFIHSLISKIVELRTTKTKVSSSRALALRSLSYGAQLRYLAYANNRLNEGTEEERKKKDIVSSILRLIPAIYGESDSDNKLDSEDINFLNDYKEGNLNVDMVYQGLLEDRSKDETEIYQAIQVAHKYLNVPLKEIYQKIVNMGPDEEEIYLSNGELTIAVPTQKRDKGLEAMKSDTRMYHCQQADDAMILNYVTKVFREITIHKGDKPFHHVAVETLTFQKYKNYLPFYDEIRAAIKEHIELTVPYNQQDAALMILGILTAQGVFQVYFEGVINIENDLVPSKVIPMRAEVVQGIRNSMMKRFETTFALTEQAVNTKGEFFSYTVNATILPDLVVPAKDAKLKEYPLKYEWFEIPDEATREQLVTRGYIPANHEPMKGRYAWFKSGSDRRPSDDKLSRTAIFHHGENIEEVEKNKLTATHYTRFMNDHLKSLGTNMEPVEAPPYKWYLYEGLYRDELEEYREDMYKDRTSNTPVAMYLGPIKDLERKEVIQRFPEYQELFDLSSVWTHRSQVYLYQGLTADELVIVDSPEETIQIDVFPQESALVVDLMTERVFTYKDRQLYEIDLENIGSYDNTKYKIKKIHDKMYLVKDVRGDIYRIDLTRQ